MSRFPLESEIEIKPKLKLQASQIAQIVGPWLTPERCERINEVVDHRTFNSTVVLEDIYDRGNVSAVMRSAEAFGFGSLHVIESGERFKAANRVTQGADKWLEVRRWKSTVDCVKSLKGQGYKILATSLKTKKSISDVDVTGPTAFVLGNEKDGISDTMAELADELILIPMQGFVQSFNISVAGALCLYHIYLERVRKFGSHGDLTAAEKEVLKAHYYLRSLDSAPEKIEAWLKRD